MLWMLRIRTGSKKWGALCWRKKINIIKVVFCFWKVTSTDNGMVTSPTLTNKPTYIHTEESVMCDVKTNIQECITTGSYSWKRCREVQGTQKREVTWFLAQADIVHSHGYGKTNDLWDNVRHAFLLGLRILRPWSKFHDSTSLSEDIENYLKYVSKYLVQLYFFNWLFKIKVHSLTWKKI